MIRALRYILLGAIALFLIVVAMANRESVGLQALPPDLAAFTGLTWGVQVPLFLVIFGSIIVGLLIGFVWEWMREHKYRSHATNKAREAARLERELATLRDAKGQPQDDVLALLQDSRKIG